MKPNEIIELMDDIARSLPLRMLGNEINAIIAKRVQPLVATDRNNLIQALKILLSFRVSPSKRTHEDARPEARLWMALDIAEDLQLYELKSDVESLLKDVREEKALRPVHAPTIERHLESLNLLEMTNRKELIEALRKHLSVRRASAERTYQDAIEEGNIWMALNIAKRRSIYELKPDVAALLKDAQENKVLYPAELPSVEKYLESFNKMPKKFQSHIQ